jgi:hypothetical protein
MLLRWIKKMFGGSTSEVAESSFSNAVEPPSENDLFDEFRAYISREISAGYSTPDEALETATDLMSDDVSLEILKSKGPEILTEELAAHLTRQEDWPDVTDCDRLDSAFEALEANGIVSRQNFTCCGSCGAAEIWDEMEEFRNAGKIVRGYAFFHMQDTESATDGHGLYLSYGSVDEGEAAAVAIGHDIQHELETHGLSTDWDGKLAKRIGLSLDWKRRLNLSVPDRLN